jgi:hypothetical protein
MSASTGAMVGGIVSSLLSAGAAAEPRRAVNLSESVTALSAALVVGVSAGEEAVVLSSPNLNVSTEVCLHGGGLLGMALVSARFDVVRF